MCSSGEYNFGVVVKHWSELVSLLSKKKTIIRYQKICLILYNVEIENCFWFIGKQFFQGFLLVRFVIERFTHIIKVCHPHIRLFQGIFFIFQVPMFDTDTAYFLVIILLFFSTFCFCFTLKWHAIYGLLSARSSSRFSLYDLFLYFKAFLGQPCNH